MEAILAAFLEFFSGLRRVLYRSFRRLHAHETEVAFLKMTDRERGEHVGTCRIATVSFRIVICGAVAPGDAGGRNGHGALDMNVAARIFAIDQAPAGRKQGV